MRPTTGAMLQQNNNNNHPCLSTSACPQEMLQRCSRASLPFPSRVELGLGDLPLIRGLRAWALCSRNRRKAGSTLGAGKAPAAPPLGRGTSTSCPRPADVYLSGYGLPLGLDARQAGIGALVTVATLKTPEGGGKTQTQCLFLRTEKGSCLYSTARPGSGASPGVVGEWLRGKRGGGDEGGTRTLPAEAGANRVRVRSGRRWRRSGVAAGRERKAVSRERQQRSCRRAGSGVGERDKGGAETQQSPGETCVRRNSRTEREQEGAESPARGAANPEEKEASGGKQRNGEEGRVSDAVSDAPDCAHGNPDGSSGVDGDQEKKRAERLEEPQTPQEQDGFMRRGEDANTEELRKPEHESKQDTETEKEVKSSPPVEGAVGSADQDTLWVYPEQEGNQLEVELGPGAEHKGVIGEEPDVSGPQPQEPNSANEEPLIFPQQEENNILQEEKGALCWPVRRRDLSASENSEGRIGKRGDGPTCTKRDDEEERRSSTSGEKEGDTSTGSWKSAPAFNPAPSLPPLESMGTGLPCQEVEGEKGEPVGVAPGHERGRKQTRSPGGEPEDKAEEARGSTVATEEGRKEEEEEDEFGVFMQAEGEAARSEGVNMSASVPCGSIAAPGSYAITGDDTWTAFPQDPSDESRDAAEQWWPAGAVEARRDGPPTNHSLVAVFAEAFPPLPGYPMGDSYNLEAVPTLTQLLRGKTRQDQGLLDSFHDLNKMIGQSHKRSNSASQNLLLKTLQLQPPLPESRPTSWTTNRRLSPGLSSANQHAAAKRRLSYDHNRNIVE